MRETTDQAASRAADLMRQGAAVITWHTDPRYTAVGVIWADSTRDHATAWAEQH